MKKVVVAFACAGLAGFVTLAASPASAQRAGAYPWCAGNVGDPTSNCGFTSYRQCMASIQGMGTQTCSRNPQFGGSQPGRRRYY
jgi:hypothetical protein